MLKPDFTKYSLALVQNNKIIFTSSGAGLRSLLECVKTFKGKRKNCILHDKVVGLAAARIIVYSEIISGVETKLASEPAVRFLGENNLKINADKIVKNILTNDRLSVCPMEQRALKAVDNKEFFVDLEKLILKKNY